MKQYVMKLLKAYFKNMFNNSKYNVKSVKDLQMEMENRLKTIPSNTSSLLENVHMHRVEILKVYREVFSTLIDRAVTFKPLLQPIREAYENVIEIKDEYINYLKVQNKAFFSSKPLLHTDRELQCLKTENKSITQECNDQKSKIKNLEALVDKIEAERFSDHMSLVEERSIRHKLFFENVQLHIKVKELDGSNTVMESSYGDPVILKIALDNCRENLSAALKDLKTMTEDYSETVPRNMHDALESKFLDVTKQLELSEVELKKLQVKYNKIHSQHESLKDDILELKDKLSELERNGTPRPEWDICADVIGGGGQRWKAMKRGLTSKETVRALVKELGPSSEAEHLEYFDGLGFDPIIPSYLQHEGKIRNLRLNRRELSILITDIWNSKIETGQDMPMQDFITIYFESRYQQQSIRTEWVYNLCCGCEQMLDDPQIKLFWCVLNGPLSPELYTDHRNEWYKLKENILKAAKDSDKIIIEDLEKVIKNTYPLKNEIDQKNIIDVVKKTQKIRVNSNEVDLEKLFQETEEGFDRNELAKELFRQKQKAQDMYLREIINELGGKKKPNKMITVENLKRAFAVIDPHIDHIRMEKYIRWVFSDKKSSLDEIYPLQLKVLASRLASGNIERIGPRYKGVSRIRK